MKQVNKLIPHALTAIRESGLLLKDKLSMLKEYDGYAASFAPSVITAGLNATLSFYSDKHKAKDGEVSKPRRHHLLQLLLVIYGKKYEIEASELVKIDLLEKAVAFTLAKDTLAERQLKRDLIEMATALKLAMRNFRQEEDANDTTEHITPKTPAT